MSAIGPGDDEYDATMRDLFAKLHRGASHAVQRQGSRDETRYASRDHAGARRGALFLRDPHATDIAPQRPGHAIGERLGMIPAGECQPGAIREIADGNEGGIAVTNDVQATVD